jgi:8-amino-7-oxononanoate synthase
MFAAGIYEEVERELASFIGAPCVLSFPTVTLLHMGVLPILARPGAAILVNEAAHR